MISIPPETSIGEVRLRVRNLAVASDFYKNVIGFRELIARPGETRLSASGEEPAQLVLIEDHLAPPRKASSPGLFHTAFLLPSRKSLAVALERLIERETRIHGFADHGVSEAIYLADPEGNGVELARDRPRDTWVNREGKTDMVTEPLDVAGLLRELEPPHQSSQELDRGTTIGHIHLQVSDLARAETFYHDILGFDVTQRTYPGALFLSAGGYHHHLGLNIWNSRNAGPAPGTAGLASFRICVPDREALQALAARFEDNEYPVEKTHGDHFFVHDPDGIPVHLAVLQDHIGAASIQSSHSQETKS